MGPKPVRRVYVSPPRYVPVPRQSRPAVPSDPVPPTSEESDTPIRRQPLRSARKTVTPAVPRDIGPRTSEEPDTPIRRQPLRSARKTAMSTPVKREATSPAPNTPSSPGSPTQSYDPDATISDSGSHTGLTPVKRPRLGTSRLSFSHYDFFSVSGEIY